VRSRIIKFYAHRDNVLRGGWLATFPAFVSRLARLSLCSERYRAGLQFS